MAYEIILKNETSQGGAGAVAGQGEENTSPAKSPLIGNSTTSKIAAAGLVAWKQVKPWVNRVVSHEVSMVELRTGSREQQEKTSFTYQIINDGVDVVESAATGLLISGGNPIGTLIGLATGLISKLVGYAQNQNRINTERAVENVGLRQNYIRAGARGSRSE